MKENIDFYFMHTHALFSLTLILLWFNTPTTTSFGHRLVAAAGGADSMCIDKERQALLDLKAPLHDPMGVLSTWTSDKEDDCCQWRGVTCSNQTGHVTELELYAGLLEGEISFSLLNLSYLNHLDLSVNNFHGNILEFIGSMTHLTYLQLGDNQFGGSIPKSIGHLTHLTFLELRTNHFTGTIPESIGNMTRLTFLGLGENNFNGRIPDSIGSLTQLIYLQLMKNQFTGNLPESIGNMTQLTSLGLSGNNFSGIIPRSIGSLIHLETLDLGSLGSCRVKNLDWLSSLSKLEGLSMDGISMAKENNWVNVIIALPNLWILSLFGCDLPQVMRPYSPSVNSSISLENIYLGNNNLNSSMFRWLCPLIGNKLRDLSLSGNKFDGKLSDFLNNLSGCSSASTLDTLEASGNQFTGSLSSEIQHFSSLERLNLSSNELDGTISDKLWELPNLRTLDLSSNSLRGVISGNIGKSNLYEIYVSNNSLEGLPLIADMSNISRSLEHIDFSSNKLGPRFPKWIQKMKNLFHLDLSNNNITETLTKEYWIIFKQLQQLDLSLNNISGALPESFSRAELVLIDLSFNNFYGSVPAFPSGIRFVDLSSNRFHGQISFLCQRYEQLSFLDLSHNSLTGELPDCLWNVTELEILNLGHNILSGRLPPSVGSLGQLKTLSLYNNSFSGELPLSLQNCTNLRVLDFGANKFFGNVPVWIGENLSRLFVLSLRSNNFVGIIPLQICQLVTLQILDLSMNNLHGKIPSCVNNFATMVQKGYVSNQNIHHYQWSANMNNHAYHELIHNSYIDRLLILWQGKVNEFSRTLGLVKTIDLSSNNLTGPIPDEVTTLHGLLVLDLSNNSLIGEIPQEIGQMAELLTLRLSRNMFSGKMPSSMSDMHSLNDLDVSYNNLSGRVPSSTQLQSFPSERFTGNVGLCGLPTLTKCLEDEDQGVPRIGDSKGDGDSTGELQRWFYIGGASGFATAFWIAGITLLLNRRLRHAFFHFHDCLKDWVYVTVVVFIARLQRVAHSYYL